MPRRRPTRGFLALLLVFAACGTTSTDPPAEKRPEATESAAATSASASSQPASASPVAQTSSTSSAGAAPSAAVSASASASAPVPEEARDPKLANCCTAFNAYATGYVADRGPDMSHVARKCVALWERGFDRTRAEPVLKPMAVARWRWPRACQPDTP